ncbi:MAG: enoyl-CoA hydratase/isomerase family protein, partial [Patulibacter sp.]|nr:enoyl-CoA hydratase/isomerase family protein [Patulibacter sp.]
TATGKFWSNGLDLEWMAANQDEIPQLVEDIHEVYARFFAANVATVAAIQGHAFAAGAMLSLTHDAIVMREDRGYWCVPEVDIRIPFTPGMVSLLQARLTPAVANEAMTTGRRYSGPQAVEAGIAVATVAEDQVLATAVDLAEQRAAKDPATLGAIKSLMYAQQLEVLRGPQGIGVPGNA